MYPEKLHAQRALGIEVRECSPDSVTTTAMLLALYLYSTQRTCADDDPTNTRLRVKTCRVAFM